jgi:hypothetical protein
MPTGEHLVKNTKFLFFFSKKENLEEREGGRECDHGKSFWQGV